MDASVGTERKHAFVVKELIIKQIWSLFQDRIGETSLTVKCADGLDRRFNTWKQFLSFNNPPQKKICHLVINSKSEDWKKSARVEFSDSSWRPIYIGIEGSEQMVSRLYDEASDILDGSRPWYWRLTKIDFFYVIGFVIWFFFMVIYQYISDKPKGSQQSIEFGIAVQRTIVSIGIVGILTIAIWGLNKLRIRYFPIAYFAIGQGEERYKLDEKIRWSILIGFIISFTASAIISVF